MYSISFAIHKKICFPLKEKDTWITYNTVIGDADYKISASDYKITDVDYKITDADYKMVGHLVKNYWLWGPFFIRGAFFTLRWGESP